MGNLPRWRDVARQRDVPLLVVAYRLLACVVRELDRPVRIAAWEHPWIRTVSQTGTGRTRHVRLPAAATLTQDNSGGEQPRGLLLLPDLGTIPVASYRPVLRGIDRTDSHVGCQCKRRTAPGCGCRRRPPLIKCSSGSLACPSSAGGAALRRRTAARSSVRLASRAGQWS